MINLTSLNKITLFNLINLFFQKVYKKYKNFELAYLHKRQFQSDFTYNLESIKKAINSPKIKVTRSNIKDDDSFEKWLNN